SYSLHAASPPERYARSLHDALPIYVAHDAHARRVVQQHVHDVVRRLVPEDRDDWLVHFDVGVNGALAAHRRPLDRFGVAVRADRSEEHTSELQSRENLGCRLLLEKK